MITVISKNNKSKQIVRLEGFDGITGKPMVEEIELSGTTPVTSKGIFGRKRDLPQAFEDHPDEFNITDRIIFQQSRPGRPTRAQLRMARKFDADMLKLERKFRIDILKVLEEFGEEVERATLEVLGDTNEPKRFHTVDFPVNKDIPQNQDFTVSNIEIEFIPTKDASQDAMDAAMINAALNTEKIINDLTIVYESHYKRISRATQRSIIGSGLIGGGGGVSANVAAGAGGEGATINLAISILDETEAVILSEGGKRVGLLDIPGKTKRKIFEQLSQGRLEGESVPQLARRLRDFIPSGRFKKASTRATLIARTETVNAQRESAIATYSANRVTEVLVLDARKGPTDIDCETWNGQIVSLEQGQRLVQDEHPNGTRMLIAMPPEIVEE